MPNDTELLQQVLQEQSSMRTEIKNLSERMEEQRELTKSVQTLTLTVRDLVNEQSHTGETVGCLKRDVDELKGKPGKRWESLVITFITLAAGAVFGYVVTRVGLK